MLFHSLYCWFHDFNTIIVMENRYTLCNNRYRSDKIYTIVLRVENAFIPFFINLTIPCSIIT